MGDPISTSANVSHKAKSSNRKGGRFKVSQQPILDVAPPEPVPVASSSPAAQHFSHEAVAVQANHPRTLSEESHGPLPESYHHDSLFLTARDPHWLFSYWDFDPARVPVAEMRDGRRAYFLRVNRLSGEVETIVEINPGAKNWYLPVRHGDTKYVAELGYFNRQGLWRCVVRSGEAHTPGDALTPESAESFATVPPSRSFAELQELVQQHMLNGESLVEAVSRITNDGRSVLRAGAVPSWSPEQKQLLAMLLGESLASISGLGSEEIDRLLRKGLQLKLHSESASGLSGAFSALAPSGASLFSPFGGARERGFFMHLNAEIIFYGGTQPGSRVTINGQPVALDSDGSFRFHYTLPDGDFEIPVGATSPDGREHRAASLAFSRQTQRAGIVNATHQPAHLEPLMGRQSA